MFSNLASFALLTVTPVLATTSVMIATPTLPTSVTSVQQVNSVLATASTSPALGSPGSLNNYPLCAQICNNETLSTGLASGAGLASGDFNDLRTLCGPEIRGLTSGCQAATCDAAEQNRTNILSQQLCGSLYNANATYSSQVSVAVASATAAAIAATKGKDPLKVSDYPKCARPIMKCLLTLPFSASNHVSLKTITTAVEPTSPSVLYLAEVLCESEGGILTHPINYTSAVNNGTIRNGTNTTVGAPSPSPFRGAGTQERSNSVGVLIVTGFAIAVGMIML
ncbi:MAG: hypothetical protein Q9200_005495, partial [Gallowayella weberi]